MPERVEPYAPVEGSRRSHSWSIGFELIRPVSQLVFVVVLPLGFRLFLLLLNEVADIDFDDSDCIVGGEPVRVTDSQAKSLSRFDGVCGNQDCVV